jgi:hypothetical protein
VSLPIALRISSTIQRSVQTHTWPTASARLHLPSGWHYLSDRTTIAILGDANVDVTTTALRQLHRHKSMTNASSATVACSAFKQVIVTLTDTWPKSEKLHGQIASTVRDEGVLCK